MNIRIIPRLDIKGINVIKGIQMDGLRVLGNPNDFAKKYFEAGADEIAFFDVVASLYGRNNLLELIREVAQSTFLPLTVTGGIRNLEDARLTMASGADKVGLNTGAINNPKIIHEVARVFGNQAAVISIEARRISTSSWEAFTESGREPSGRDVLEWVKQVESLGAGEISITSVDKDGTLKGPDLDLINEVRCATSLPLVAGGGIANVNHVLSVAKTGVDGILVGLALHKELFTIKEAKVLIDESGFSCRLNFK